MNISINTKIKTHLREIGMGEDALDDCLDNLKIVVQTGTTCQVFDIEGNHKHTIDIDNTNYEQYALAFFE